MRLLRRTCFLGAGSLLLLSPTPVRGAQKETFVGADDKWRYYQSANFELYSRNTEGESRDLLHHLELLRAVCLERFHLVETARVEVTLFYFGTLEDFRAYGPAAYGKNNSFKGYYLPGPDRAVISLAPTNDADSARRIIFHEYVHHLFRTTEEDPPVWFNEGMAELLAGIQVDGKTLKIGLPQPGRILALRGEKLLPLETLFAVNYQSPIYRSNDHTGLFYAQSWALLHYWYYGKSSLPEGGHDRFLKVAGDRKTAEATDLRALFQQCFGIDYPEMRKRLENYISSGRFTYGWQTAPKTEPASSYAARPVSREEIRLRLAELALRVNRAPMAKLFLLEATEKNPGDPRPFEVLGTDAYAERDENGVRDRWEQAVAAGTHNVAIYRELGLRESRAWFQNFNYYFRLPPDQTDRLRERLLRSIDYAPQQSAAYEMLAWVEAYAEEPSIKNVNLVQQHFPGLKHQQRTLLALAFVRVRLDKPAEAKTMLDGLDKMEPDVWTEHAAEVVRAKLEGRPVRPSPKSNSGKGVQRLPQAPLKIPSIDVPKNP